MKVVGKLVGKALGLKLTVLIPKPTIKLIAVTINNATAADIHIPQSNFCINCLKTMIILT